MKNELSIGAILIGIATIYGISILIGLGSAFAVTGLIHVNRVPSREEMHNDLHSLLFVGSKIALVFGGFVAGWIARHDQLKNAFALAIVDLMLNTTLAMFRGSAPVLPLLEGILMNLLAILGGGYLAKLAFGGRVTL